MVQASTASHFWAVVGGCLVHVHGFERDAAAERAKAFWRQLPTSPNEKCNEPSFEDMIYRAELWHVACNPTRKCLPFNQYQSEYRDVLRRNELA